MCTYVLSKLDLTCYCLRIETKKVKNSSQLNNKYCSMQHALGANIFH